VGYAIDEAGFGTTSHGVFTDLVKHVANQRQTVTYASSVDPWHRDADRVRNQEQPGLDIVFLSGITRGIPATVPIPMMYSTPDNAAAEIRYLEARGYAIARVEMGEEPDGQYVTPEDDAALYVQFADAVHAVDPGLRLGGPVFESNSQDVKAWRNALYPGTSWTKRFIAYLASHNHLGDLSFSGPAKTTRKRPIFCASQTLFPTSSPSGAATTFLPDFRCSSPKQTIRRTRPMRRSRSRALCGTRS
jgi:hypothetical protein